MWKNFVLQVLTVVFQCMQIDLLAEISQAPRILSEVDALLRAKQMKADIDEYLKVCCHIQITGLL